MEKIVICMGGSVLFPDEVDVSFFKKLNVFLKELSRNHKVFIVVGGGKTARKYIKTGRELGFSENILDQIGIDITRVNAYFLAKLIKTCNEKIPGTIKEAQNVKNNIVVMGGTTPGHSTDMVGAELAESVNADKLIIATNVDGVYTGDPNKYKDSQLIKEMPLEELISKYGTKWEKAGRNMVIDPPALKIINRSKISTYVVNGKNLREIKKLVENQPFIGTTIKTN